MRAFPADEAGGAIEGSTVVEDEAVAVVDVALPLSKAAMDGHGMGFLCALS